MPIVVVQPPRDDAGSGEESVCKRTPLVRRGWTDPEIVIARILMRNGGFFESDVRVVNCEEHEPKHIGFKPELKKGFFLISSRRRHTRLVSDWSSDVCSSD